MKKRELSPVELKKVVELRQFGANWTEIEQKTGVERRAAKRAYEEWESDKKAKEQESVRFRVAAEAFHDHLDDLVKTAESLVSALRTPDTPRGLTTGDEVLNKFQMGDTQKEGDREVWRNKRLFKSLQEHTAEKVPWDDLKKWKDARNNAAEYLETLRLRAIDVVNNTLNDRPGLKGRIQEAITDIDVTGRISDGLIQTIWRSILTGKPDEMNTFKGGGSTNSWKVWLVFYENDCDTRLDLNDSELAMDVLGVCREAVANLRDESQSHAVQELTVQVQRMQDLTGELERSLDALVLRPAILRTRCDICPV